MSEEINGGLILTIDGATGYFPEAFIIEAIRTHMKRGTWYVSEWDRDGDKFTEKPYDSHKHPYHDIYCSVCKNSAPCDGYGNYYTSEYCPNCGARMKGADNG